MRTLTWGLIAALAAALVVGRATLPPYDDALFFSRFAHNALAHGAFSWNPGEPALHGNTSQLHQLLLLGLHALVPEHGLQAARWLGAAVLGAGAWLLARRFGDGPVAFALAGWIALATVVSGMETAMTLGLGAGFLVACWRPTPPSLGVVAAGVALLYLARPDTGLLTVGTLLVAPWPWRERLVRLGLVAVALGLVLAVLQLGYGRALPLSFAVKAGGAVAEPVFLAKSHAAKLRHLGLFVLCTVPLLAWARPGQRARLLLPAGAFVAFQAGITLDVMGLHGRFFAPCLPWLAVAATAPPNRVLGGTLLVLLGLFASLGPGWGWLPGPSGWAIGQLPTLALWATVLGGGALLLAPAGWRSLAVLATALGAQLVAPGETAAVVSDQAHVRGLTAQTKSWRRVHDLRDCLGNDAHLVHSEVGVPGLVFPEGRITDLGGLMNAAVADGSFVWERFCAAERPAIVYLPHPNYRVLREELETSACLEDYTLVDSSGSSPVYIRTDLAAVCEVP